MSSFSGNTDLDQCSDNLLQEIQIQIQINFPFISYYESTVYRRDRKKHEIASRDKHEKTRRARGCLLIVSESGVRASANAHSRSYMSMHADPS